jgi:hypothetical protein
LAPFELVMSLQGRSNPVKVAKVANTSIGPMLPTRFSPNVSIRWQRPESESLQERGCASGRHSVCAK